MKLYWGWVVCLCFLLLFTITAGIAFSFSEVMIPLNREMHESVALLGWIGSMPASLPMLLAPLGTMAHYKLGTKRTVFIGIFITSLSLAIAATVDNIGLLFLFYGLLMGVGMVFIVNPPFFLLEEYFPYSHPRHVLATSIIACAFPLATLAFNPLTYVILARWSWRITYSIYALSMFVIGGLCAMSFRHKHKEEKDPAYEELDENHHAMADEASVEDQPLAHRTKVILGTMWFFASTLKSMGYYTPFVTLVKQMDVLGIPQSKSSQAMSVVGGCELFSRILTSYVGDYFKGRIIHMYVLCTFVLCIQNALGSMAYSFSHLVAYAAALGLFGGPVIAAMYSSCSEVYGGQGVHTLFTIFRVGLGLGAVMGPTLAGAIFDHTNSFLGVFYVNSAIYFMTSMLYLSIILLNKYRPLCCFPDTTEQLSLVNNLKGPSSQMTVINHSTFVDTETDTSSEDNVFTSEIK